MNKSSESYKVYLDKTEAAASGATTGSNKVQSEGYPGRPMPPTDNTVGEAKVMTGTAHEQQKKQTGENRVAINKHVEEKKEFGPNN